LLIMLRTILSAKCLFNTKARSAPAE
jgi:hypothetical protein